jgi:hypothetical protein
MRKMKYENDEHWSETCSPQKSVMLSPTLSLMPSNFAGAFLSRMPSTSIPVVAQKDVVQRHSNPSTSHVSTTYASFTPSKTSSRVEDFRQNASEKSEAFNVPNALTETIPNSMGLFDRMKLQSRQLLESRDTENSEFLPPKLTHTPSRLTTFMDSNQRLVPGSTRLQESSLELENKAAVSGHLKDVERLMGLNTQASVELDPIQASELWQKARDEQKMLRTSQITGNFDESWRNINTSRKSIFRNSQSPDASCERQNLKPNQVASPGKDKDLSARDFITTPRTRLEHLVSGQAFGDSVMKMNDLTRNIFPTSGYDRL